MSKKSAKKSATGKPFTRGRDPRQGKGPAKGAPNAGRPPSAIREAYRMGAFARVQFLYDVIDGRIEADSGDRLRAWDMLNKYGIGTTITETDADGANKPTAIAFTYEIVDPTQ